MAVCSERLSVAGLVVLLASAVSLAPMDRMPYNWSGMLCSSLHKYPDVLLGREHQGAQQLLWGDWGGREESPW